jgi:hypothetical protein
MSPEAAWARCHYHGTRAARALSQSVRASVASTKTATSAITMTAPTMARRLTKPSAKDYDLPLRVPPHASLHLGRGQRRGIDRHRTETWRRSVKFSASSRLRDLDNDMMRHQRISSIPIIDRDHVTTIRAPPSQTRIEFSVTTTCTVAHAKAEAIPPVASRTGEPEIASGSLPGSMLCVPPARRDPTRPGH